MRVKKQLPFIKTEWFEAQLLARKMSRRGLARLLGLDASTVSLMLRGIRGWKHDNITSVAEIFGVSPGLIMENLGHPVMAGNSQFTALSDLDQLTRAAHQLINCLDTSKLNPKQLGAFGILVQVIGEIEGRDKTA